MKTFIFLIAIFTFQDIPFKPKDEFEIKLDYQFKQRPPADRTSVHFDETQKERDRRTSTAMLPYLTVKVNLLKLSEETRVRITNNIDRASINKKVADGTSLSIVFGFTDDAKDRVTAHEYVLTFLSPEKEEINRIIIHIEEDGTFLVNGEKRGKL